MQRRGVESRPFSIRNEAQFIFSGRNSSVFRGIACGLNLSVVYKEGVLYSWTRAATVCRHRLPVVVRLVACGGDHRPGRATEGPGRAPQPWAQAMRKTQSFPNLQRQWGPWTCL